MSSSSLAPKRKNGKSSFSRSATRPAAPCSIKPMVGPCGSKMELRLPGGARPRCLESATKAAPAIDIFRACLLPARNIAHIREMMRDAFVAIDTGLLTSEQKTLVRLDSPRTLSGGVHRLRAVAVTALQGIVCLHASPFMNRQLQPVVQKLFARVDRAEELSPDFL